MTGKGLRINFQGNVAKIDFEYPLETNIDCMAQNAVVNLASAQGSDNIYPEKGSNLVSRMMSGVAFNKVAAGHVANHAAIKSRRFINEHIPKEQDDILDILELQLDGVSDVGSGWKFKARVKSSLGTESTVTWTIDP